MGSTTWRTRVYATPGPQSTVVHTWKVARSADGDAGPVVQPPIGAGLELTIANSDGNWLVATVGWHAVPGAPTTITIGDDAANRWIPVATSDIDGGSRTTIWVAPNARPTTRVSIAPQGQETAVAVIVAEVTGMPDWLTVDQTETVYAPSTTNSIAGLPTPSQPCLVLAAGCVDVYNAGWTLGASTWAGADEIAATTINGNTYGQNYGDIDLTLAWQTASASTISSWSGASAADLSVVMCAIQLTPVEPAAPNPSWPRLTVEAAFGAGVSTAMDEIAAGAEYTPRVDNFARTVAGGWGTATSGQAWSTSGGTGTNYAVLPGAGQQVTTALNTTLHTLLAGVGLADVDQAVTVTVPGTPPAGGTYAVGLVARRIDASNVYAAELVIAASGATSVRIRRTLAGVTTDLATLPLGMVHTPGTAYRMRFLALGDGLLFRAWLNAGPEPTWWCTAADTNFGGGAVGCRSTVAATGTPPLPTFAWAGYTASDPSVYWVDISDRLLSQSIARGRQYELDALESAEATLVFRNEDGALSPGGGGYNPQVYTPIRIVARWEGRDYMIFGGFVERWPQSWADPHWGTIQAIAVDGWATLTATLPTVLRGELLLDQPDEYWPLDDPEGTGEATNASGTSDAGLTLTPSKHGTASSVPAFGDSSIPLVGDPGSGWGLTGLTAGQGSLGWALVWDGTALPPISGGVTIACWSLVDGDIGSDVALITLVGPTGPIVQVYSATTGGQIGVRAWDATTGAFSTVIMSSGGFHGVPVYVTLTVTRTSVQLWLIGHETPYTATVNLASTWTTFSAAGRVDGFGHGNFGNQHVSHLAIWGRVLQTGRLLNYQWASVFGEGGDPADRRIARLLSYTTWAGPRRISYASGDGMAPAADIAGQDVASSIGNIAATDMGLLYVDRCGYLVYRSRLHANARGVQYVLGDGPGEVPYKGDVVIDYDPQYVVNDVQVTQYTASGDGVVIVARDEESIAQYADRTLQVTSYFGDLSASTNLANWLLSQYKQPSRRVETVTVDPAANPTLWARVLATDVGDRLILNRRSIGAPALSLDVVVIAVTHDTAVGDDDAHWLVTLSLMPLSVLAASSRTLILDDPIRGQLDAGNIIDW